MLWNLTDLRTLLISWLPVLIKTKPMLCFCFHWLQKSAFFFPLCDTCFVFDFAIYFPDSFLFQRDAFVAMLLSFSLLCLLSPPQVVHTMDAVPFSLLTSHIPPLLYRVTQSSQNVEPRKDLVFCRFSPNRSFSPFFFFVSNHLPMFFFPHESAHFRFLLLHFMYPDIWTYDGI